MIIVYIYLVQVGNRLSAVDSLQVAVEYACTEQDATIRAVKPLHWDLESQLAVVEISETEWKTFYVFEH